LATHDHERTEHGQDLHRTPDRDRRRRGDGLGHLDRHGDRPEQPALGAEDGFLIERAVKSGKGKHSSWSAYARVATVGANARTFTESLPKATYRYRVQAYQGTATSAYSGTAKTRKAAKTKRNAAKTKKNKR
jgi:hypothetical protein